MTQAYPEDIWGRWILYGRYGDDPRRRQAVLANVNASRDKVLGNARIGEGDLVLDLGCGAGMLGFGALEQVPSSRVIFCDTSRYLLHHVQTRARELDLLDRCRFLHAPADDLSALDDASIDVVLVRAVLVYVPNKRQVFREVFRVLKPRGRLSVYEPIYGYGRPEPEQIFWGYDVTPVIELANKVKDLYDRLQPPGVDPMFDFDERDLVVYAEQAGFREVYLELKIGSAPPPESMRWETLWRTAANPKVPTFGEAVELALTPEEAARFIAHLRPLVERRQGVDRSAVAFLWAVK